MTQSVFDLTAFDPAIPAADDLYRHVNGHFLANATIPDDKMAIGAFDSLRDESEKAIHAICQDLTADTSLDPADERAKIATLYGSFMAEDTVEALGAQPLRPFLDRIDAIATVDDLRDWFGWCLANGLSTLIDASVDADPGDPTRYRLFVGQDGLGLPDEAYYHEPEQADIRQQYRHHLAATLALAAGRDQPAPTDETEAEAVFDLESAIAAQHWDIVKTRDLKLMYNPRALPELGAEAPGFGWDRLLAAAAWTGRFDQVINAQPSFFPGVAGLLTDEQLPAWRAWARFHLVDDLSPYLSTAFVETRFRFYGTTLTGQPVNRPRWKRGVRFTESAMGEALGKIYVASHYPPEAERRMDELVANLLAAYRSSIEALDWMGPETKAEALAKLANFRPKIGHPKKWRDFTALVVGDDLIGNVLAVGRFDTDYEITKLAGPVDPDEWEMYPQTVNAYYHPLRNEIVFPAAICQPPFFNVAADDAVNYGGIGAVIGHEIGHGFDDQGSATDGDGRLRDWWTPEDHAAFEARTAALIAQYDALSPAGAPGRHVNGALTIGENIGDLGGLGIAWKAWRFTQPEAAAIDGFTPEQRFFFSWALCWQQAIRDEYAATLLSIDPHSPNEFRCNQVVRNLDEYYAAFSVSQSDQMYLPPEQRVTIW